MSCGFSSSSRVFLSIHQCMRNTLNSNKEIFLYRKFNTQRQGLKPVSLVKLSEHPIKNSNIRYDQNRSNSLLKKHQIEAVPLPCNFCSKTSKTPDECNVAGGEEKAEKTGKSGKTGKAEKKEKVGIYKQFKTMFKEYWYVLVPVHIVTSCFWFGSFYYMACSGRIAFCGCLERIAESETDQPGVVIVSKEKNEGGMVHGREKELKETGITAEDLNLWDILRGGSGRKYVSMQSGMDIPALLENLGAPDSWVEKFKSTKAGNIFVAYTLYKVVTPIRYTVTVGGTTLSIKYLKQLGWIKPVPNKEQLKKIYQEQKDVLKDFKATCQDKMQVTKSEFNKSKKEVKKQIEMAKEAFHRTMKETRDDLKEGARGGAEEWRTISKAFKTEMKETFGSSKNHKSD